MTFDNRLIKFDLRVVTRPDDYASAIGEKLYIRSKTICIEINY